MTTNGFNTNAFQNFQQQNPQPTAPFNNPPQPQGGQPAQQFQPQPQSQFQPQAQPQGGMPPFPVSSQPMPQPSVLPQVPAQPVNLEAIFANIGNANSGKPEAIYTRGGRYILQVSSLFLKNGMKGLTIVMEATVVKAITDKFGKTPNDPTYQGFRVGDIVGAPKTRNNMYPGYFDNYMAAIFCACSGRTPKTASDVNIAFGTDGTGSPFVGTFIEAWTTDRPTQKGTQTDVVFGKSPVSVDAIRQGMTQEDCNILATNVLFTQAVTQSQSQG